MAGDRGAAPGGAAPALVGDLGFGADLGQGEHQLQGGSAYALQLAAEELFTNLVRHNESRASTIEVSGGSGSSTDPEVNSGSIAPGLPANVYLWLNCSPVDGISAVEADVQVKTQNLTGQLKNVTMRKVLDQEAIYYIGETPVANRETLIFDISVRPEGTDKMSEVRFKRQFYTD